jgi:hypothetical protein
LKLERTLSDLVNQASGLTLREIEVVWKTAPHRPPMSAPTTVEIALQAVARLRKRADRLSAALWQAGWTSFAQRRAFLARAWAEPLSRLRNSNSRRRQSRHRRGPRGGGIKMHPGKCARPVLPFADQTKE